MPADDTMSLTQQIRQEVRVGLRDRVVSISQWLKTSERLTTTNVTTGGNNTEDEGAGKRLFLMDMRSSEDYTKRHVVCKTEKLVAATIPAHLLKERSFELPARHVKFSVLVNPADLDRVEDFLTGPRHNKTSGSKRPFKPWNIAHIILDEDSLWKEAQDLGILATPNTSDTTFPQPRLWQPDPMVENILLPILKDQLSSLSVQEETKGDEPTTSRQEIWDLGSGAGRDVVFLAEELFAWKAGTSKKRKVTHQSIPPIHLVGLDHRYNEKETNITSKFFERRGVSEITSCQKVDCSKWESFVEAAKERVGSNNTAIAKKKNDLMAMYAVRFWKPAFFQMVADDKETFFRPGTILAMSNFCKPFEGASWDFDNPNEKVVLERNHLQNIFSEKWDILHDEIAIDPDYGRPMVQFIAKRKDTP